MEISYGLVNLTYFMLCGELSRIKGSRSNKRRKLLTCFTNSLFKVYNNLSLRETGPEVYNSSLFHLLLLHNTTSFNTKHNIKSICHQFIRTLRTSMFNFLKNEVGLTFLFHAAHTS